MRADHIHPYGFLIRFVLDFPFEIQVFIGVSIIAMPCGHGMAIIARPIES